MNTTSTRTKRSHVLPMCRLFALTAVLAVGTHVGTGHACQLEKFNFIDGFDTSASMTVKPGSHCVQDLRIDAGSSNAKLQVTQMPKHGFAGTSGTTGFVYEPKKGYAGPDKFVVTVNGRNFLYAAPTKITINVTVKP